MKISVIIPIYNEINTVEEVFKGVNGVLPCVEKEIIMVDDASVDGTKSIVERLEGKNLKKIFHEKNQGKGAAIRTALKYVSGDIVIIQDADLEYHPDDYPQLLKPILEGKADVVFGSRFIGAHRCFLFTHYLGNKIVNLIANILYNTTLTDFMTCYKVFKTEVIKDIRIKSDRFGFEAEITGMIFRKNLKVYEVPISYSGRDYKEGKKITWKDFFVVVWWLFYCRFRLCKDVSWDALDKLSFAERYNSYIYEKFRAYLGKRILEIGAGNGNITRFLIPPLAGRGVNSPQPARGSSLEKRELIVAIDKSRKHLFYLSQKLPETNTFKFFCHDIEEDSAQRLKEFCFDSVVCINVLEHIKDEKKALGHVAEILGKGGVLILVIPAHKWLFSEFDRRINHFRRYDKDSAEKLLEDNGFSVENIGYFNFLGIIGWWFNFKFLKRRHLSSSQLFFFNRFVGVVKQLDKIFKYTGLSLLIVAKKK